VEDGSGCHRLLLIDECRIGGELMGAAGASRRGAALNCDMIEGGRRGPRDRVGPAARRAASRAALLAGSRCLKK
jgi:hypothetical protein